MSASKTALPWYKNYERLRDEVLVMKSAFEERCQSLKRIPEAALADFNQDSISRIVFESNWQEGIYLDQGRTKALASEAFDRIGQIAGPHLDFDFLLEEHRKQVVDLKRRRSSTEELAAYNLSKTHVFMWFLHGDFTRRSNAAMMKRIHLEREMFAKSGSPLPAAIEEALKFIRKIEEDSTELVGPVTGGSNVTGRVYRELMGEDFDELMRPMKVQHIHFFHRTLMMGILHPKRCGSFRKIPVNVGNPKLILPPASMVKELMLEYCKGFPRIDIGSIDYEPILKAAEISHRFTEIHPYEDGNGRISRVLMNLVLMSKYPLVYIKADAKGRHRYSQALRRADRGNIEPLAALIALSLKETYQKILSSLGVR